MPNLSEATLMARDAERDLDAELLESIHAMRTGKVGRISVVTRDGRVFDSPVIRARVISRLSQSQFATLLGVSVRTLQEWEQGRRAPSRAAQTLLRVAEKYPEVLRELVE
jgi:putative transcriptional regulator